MAITRDQFISILEKQAQEATAPEHNEDDSIAGMQAPSEENVPELLQPEDGPGKRPRGEAEVFSSGAEERHEENRTGGYLQNALPRFNQAAKETGQQLKGLLDHFGPQAGTSKAVADAGKDKVSSVQTKAFIDELDKINKARSS